MQTPIIKYNLNERGRRFRGKDRNWSAQEIEALVNFINSNETQERIKNRDMIGFYGHWSRVKYGMNPGEGGIEKNGKPFYIEPAVVTIHLKAYPDGTVEHQEEFLETDSGKAAAKLFQSKVGGFSSAITRSIRPQFFGFDYVFEPNYTTNRGYNVFDSVDEAIECANQMDAGEIDAAIQNEQIRGVLALLDSAQVQNFAANTTIEHLQKENESLLEQVNSLQAKIEEAGTFELPNCKQQNYKQRILDDCRAFNSLRKLPLTEDPTIKERKEKFETSYKTPLIERLLGR